ncbi:DUF2851 family protein [Sphingobacterium deserti]|uniref:DUF2851 domain-containing protein n=1 Tax=Sphingobacterium deserti TaxID=1229276 RepID=A0A0B8T621_9SPHI|nr:DUF2851 family protein [Sphingobacterium deserti]KGE13264.1 hypothetical protein DI53_2795 [Sphingobacterium deserti]
MVAEELLHFIWQFRLFNQLELYSTDDEEIKIYAVGEFNRNAGPDFLYAQLSIGGQTWFGHVELHVDGGDWFKHRHDTDEAYNNVILHVVYTNAVATYRKDGTPIPCLSIGKFLKNSMLVNYQDIMSNMSWIPCEKHLGEIPSIIKRNMLERLTIERMEEKFTHIRQVLEETNDDWEHVLFIQLARSFGMKVNADVFARFARSIDLNVIRRYKNDPFKIEAIFFGQAGFLNDGENDDYKSRLREEYRYLKRLHSLAELRGFEWKFLRMRPANFPTFRLAQLAAVYSAKPYLFDDILDCGSIHKLFQTLQPCEVGAYWRTHYRFTKSTAAHAVELSAQFKSHLIINAFVPVVFAFAKSRGMHDLQNLSLSWLEGLAAEENAITRLYRDRGYRAETAADTQGLLLLKKQYCDKKKCLSCMLGLSVLKAK